ncbi:MAG: hypothetical protein EBU54_13245 [Mycobacteriaceae bacterium]|nr:hypothetical protein [Mycobacteriaceae bacterium]
MVAVSGRFVQTSVTATVGDLLDGRPLVARPCDPTPIALPAGTQELLVSPGPAFVVDGVDLDGPLAAELSTATTTAAEITEWTPDRRQVSVGRSARARILVIPESINPGWVARTPDGATLTPVAVNGWQQGWAVPAGARGEITLSFPANAAYRTGIFAGLALLPVLAALAAAGGRRAPPGPPPRPWAPRLTAAAGLLGVGAVIAGPVGAAVFGGALAVASWLRRPDRVILLTVPAGLILAGALLSRYPWRSVEGYIGNSPWVQLPALIAVAMLAALPRTVGRDGRSRDGARPDRDD